MNDTSAERLSSCPALKDRFVVIATIRGMQMPRARLQNEFPVSSPHILKEYVASITGFAYKPCLDPLL